VWLAAITPANLNGNGRQIQTSIDNVTFTTVVNPISGATNSSITNFDFPAVSARYIRISRVSGIVDLSEARVYSSFTYTWAPGYYLTTSSGSTTTFQPGSLALPTPDPITYYLTAATSGCSFYDAVQAAVIKADAGPDVCGPTLIGTPDQTPDINETYSWVKISGPGNFLGATNLPQVPVNASPGGSTTYQLTVSYTLGGVSGSCTDQVVVSDCGCPAVNITINAPNSCPSYALNSGNVSLTASASTSIPVTFAWTTTGGVTLSANNGPTVFLTNNNSGTVTVTVTSIYDPTFSCSNSIQVNNPAWALPVFTAQDPVICPGASTSIGQANVAGYSYLWTNTSPSTLNSTTISNPTATPTATTNYPVIVTDVGSGCTTRDTATVTIVSSPANAGPDYTICANGIVTLGAPALPNTTYSWQPAASPWQNATNQFSAQPQVLVATNLTFTLTTTNTITGCTSTDAATITVSASPTIPNAPDVTICKEGSGIVIGSPAQAGVAYSWSPTTGLSNPNIAQPTANPTSTTTYTCTATFTGCSVSTTDAVIVTVNDPSFTLAPQSYCPSSGALTLSGPAGYTNYSWSPASQVASPTSQNTLTLNPPPSSAFTYTLTATKTVNSVACVGSAPLVVTPTVSGPVAGNNRNI